MITWHSCDKGLEAHHNGLTIRIHPITDDSGRVCLHVVSHRHGMSAGWVLASTEVARDQAQHMIDHMVGQ